MKVNKYDFLDALDVSILAVSKISAIEEMLNFNFVRNQIITYNGPALLNVPFELDNLVFSVPAVKFLKAVSVMPDEFTLTQGEVSITLEGEEKKTKTAFGIAQYTEHNDILDVAKKNTHKMKDVEWKDTPDNFLTGIKLCMFSVSKISNLGTLSCLQIKGKYITSSDNARISSFEMNKEMDEFLLPIENSKILLTLQPYKYRISPDENTIQFITEDDITITIRTVVGTYPEYKSVAFMKYDNYEDLILPKEVLEMANSVGIINNDMTDAEQMISISMEKNMITVATNSVAGWGRKTIELEEEIEGTFETTMRLPSFVEIVKYTSEIRIVKDLDRIVFMADNFRHVLPTAQKKKGKKASKS